MTINSAPENNPWLDAEAAPYAISMHLALAETTLLTMQSDHPTITGALDEIHKAHTRLVQLFPELAHDTHKPSKSIKH